MTDFVINRIFEALRKQINSDQKLHWPIEYLTLLSMLYFCENASHEIQIFNRLWFFMIVMFVHTWSNLPLGPDVNCSRKHCHSRDLSQRQCQRSSMIFPTDNKTEIRSFSSWLTPQFDEFFDFLRSLLCLLCASISPHCHSTVLISWLWDSMSMCKSWKWNRKRENMSNGIIHAH